MNAESSKEVFRVNKHRDTYVPFDDERFEVMKKNTNGLRNVTERKVDARRLSHLADSKKGPLQKVMAPLKVLDGLKKIIEELQDQIVWLNKKYAK